MLNEDVAEPGACSVHRGSALRLVITVVGGDTLAEIAVSPVSPHAC